MYFMSIFEVPRGVARKLEKPQKDFLWLRESGEEANPLSEMETSLT